MDERTFLLNRERAVDYLNMLDRLYVFDGYAGWDPEVGFCRGKGTRSDPAWQAARGDRVLGVIKMPKLA